MCIFLVKFTFIQSKKKSCFQRFVCVYITLIYLLKQLDMPKKPFNLPTKEEVRKLGNIARFNLLQGVLNHYYGYVCC